MCVKETHVRATAFTYMGFVFVQDAIPNLV